MMCELRAAQWACFGAKIRHQEPYPSALPSASSLWSFEMGHLPEDPNGKTACRSISQVCRWVGLCLGCVTTFLVRPAPLVGTGGADALGITVRGALTPRRQRGYSWGTSPTLSATCRHPARARGNSALGFLIACAAAPPGFARTSYVAAKCRRNSAIA